MYLGQTSGIPLVRWTIVTAVTIIAFCIINTTLVNSLIGQQFPLYVPMMGGLFLCIHRILQYLGSYNQIRHQDAKTIALTQHAFENTFLETIAQLPEVASRIASTPVAEPILTPETKRNPRWWRLLCRIHLSNSAVAGVRVEDEISATHQNSEKTLRNSEKLLQKFDALAETTDEIAETTGEIKKQINSPATKRAAPKNIRNKQEDILYAFVSEKNDSPELTESEFCKKYAREKRMNEESIHKLFAAAKKANERGVIVVEPFNALRKQKAKKRKK